MFMKWFLYILQCADGTYYTGVTKDLSRRLDEHNSSNKGAKYTRTRRPVEIVFYSEYENRSQAQKAEHKFKKMTRKQKEAVINNER